MELRLNTNLAASRAVMGLNRNLFSMSQSLQRLSSGRRINSAADDPAGLVISQQLRSQIGSLNQEIENLSANINKYQTVSATTGELRSQLTELRSLAVGAANSGFNSEEAQQAYVTAADSLIATYNRTVANAEYNGKKTMDGSEEALVTVSELSGIDMSTPEAAAASIEKIDEAASELDNAQVELGATQRNELESQRSSLEVARQNLISAESQLADADYGVEMSNFVGSLIRTQVAAAVMSHTLLSGQSVVSLLDM